MHQPFDCGNFRSKLEKLTERLDTIELLIRYAEAHLDSPSGQNYAKNAREAFDKIKGELS